MSKKERDLRMYILVNDGIKVGKGKLAGQVGHAVASYMFKTYTVHKNNDAERLTVKEYMNNHQIKIILKCPQDVLERLEKSGYTTIRDKGWTQLEPNSLTCVNLGILDSLSLPDELEFVKDLKLV